MPANRQIIKEIFTEDEQKLLSCCTLCPRECKTDRFSAGDGYCGMDAGMNIASICIHKGEEPPVSGPHGICNIFFAGCNLRCVYCQNYEISRHELIPAGTGITYEEALDRVTDILSAGIKAVGFVSPSHVVPQVKALIRGLERRGIKPVTVYNTNSYDKQETIKSLEGLIDVYLPDYKYISPETALALSDAEDYPEIALKAIKTMYYQKGSVLHTGEDGIASSGMLIRHLVLPGHAEESKMILQRIADELSPGVHISLMSQYHPTPFVMKMPTLDRVLYREEYETVAGEMEKLGFRNGWMQDMDSNINYRPDFRKKNPFE